jgi:signal transduction histidine kinase
MVRPRVTTMDDLVPEPPSRGDGLPRVAAAIAVATWALAVSSLVVLIAAHPPVGGDFWYYAVDAADAVVYGTVAAVTLSRRRHVVPWLLALAAVGGGLAAFSYAYTQLALTQTGTLPALDVVSRWQGITWVPGTLALFLVVPWLVRDSRPTPLAWAAIAAGTLVAGAFTVSRIAEIDDPIRWYSVLCVLLGLLAAGEAGWRRVRGPEPERTGLGWLAAGTAAMALAFLPLTFPTGSVELPIWFTPSLHLTSQVLFPAAVFVAVLRQRLWGLDLAVSRAVLAGALTVGLVVVYAVVATALARLLPDTGAQVIAAAVVAVAVQPVRLWLQRRVHRLVYGEGAEPSWAVRRLGRQLGRADSAEALLEGLVESVGAALRLESVRLDVAGAPVATWGTPTSRPLGVPLSYRDVVVGHLAVTPPPGESLGVRTLASLDELAGVVAAGVVLTRASQDLEAARERLTSVRLEERRVLRRELHDGLGPSLAGIRLGLQAARNLLERDPAAAGTLLAQLQDELDQRADDVRLLSRSLLPPVLDELGLGPALDELARLRRETGLDVTVHHEGLDGLDQRVAAAAYGIAAEALTNVTRHAAARRCSVTVSAGPDELVVVVDDDGRGVDPAAAGGVGTRSMRERAEEQGGTLLIASLEPGGTRVEARIPLGRA